MLTSDNCGQAGYESIFSVVVENVPCGTGQVACTKSVVFNLLDLQIILVRGTDPFIAPAPPTPTQAIYRIIKSGIFLIINTGHGKVLSCQGTANLNHSKSVLLSKVVKK